MLNEKEIGRRARENFLAGYNCSMSVVLAFSDLMELDREQLMRMVSPFGGGMGRMREVCGCVSGMYFVLGYLYGYSDPKDYEGKKELYKRVQELAEVFRQANGSIVCRDLLGKTGKDSHFVPSERTEEYYSKRPCPRLAAYAAEMLAQYINRNPYSRKVDK